MYHHVVATSSQLHSYTHTQHASKQNANTLLTPLFDKHRVENDISLYSVSHPLSPCFTWAQCASLNDNRLSCRTILNFATGGDGPADHPSTSITIESHQQCKEDWYWFLFSMNFISILMSRILFKSPKSTQWLQSNGFYFTCHEVTGEARPPTGRGRQHTESHVFVWFYTSSAFDTIWPARLSNKLLHIQDAPLVTCITTISQIGHSMWGWRTLCPKSLPTTQP